MAIRNHNNNIKYYKGKFSCPICGMIGEGDDYFMVDHAGLKHSSYDLAQRILDSMSDVMIGKKGWDIEDLNLTNRSLQK